MEKYLRLGTAMKVYLILAFQIAAFSCKAQEDRMVKDKAIHQLFATGGVGISQFRFDGATPTKFPTFDYRVGFTLHRRFRGEFGTEFSAVFGQKIRRKSYKNGVVYSLPGPPLFRHDETVSKQNHAFLEMPVLITYQLKHPNLAIKVGMFGRYWMPTEEVDMLSNRAELGLNAAISYFLSERIQVGLVVYSGLTIISKDGFTTSTSSETLVTKNLAKVLTISHGIRNRSKD